MISSRASDTHASYQGQLLRSLAPELRGVALRLIRELDEPGLDLTQLRRLQSLLKHLDLEILAAVLHWLRGS
ncbi:hypothetical protein YIM_32275 [Amycolatopsis sp. YIM 10]|nr:hypothetical protein YIM_32275 [Amycolatopsis sp. YIM 10]